MKAIKTSFLGPTNTKPSRIKASAEGVTSKIYQAYGFSHEAAALAFCEFHGWGKNLAHGQLDADTWVHCFVPERAPKLVDFLKDCVTGKIEGEPCGDCGSLEHIEGSERCAESYPTLSTVVTGRKLHSESSKQK